MALEDINIGSDDYNEMIVEIPIDILNSPDDINCSFDSGMVYEIPSATIESFSAGSF